MSDERAAFARSFDRVVTAYEFRPGYPAALFDRIIAFGGLPAEARLLEVAVGTGKATVPFAARGFRILGLEPGPRLLEAARAHLAGFPRVELLATTFEDWAVERSAFGLAYTAQAFHWLDSHRRLPLFAEALPPGGTLAIFGNVPMTQASSLGEKLQEVYAREVPALWEQRHEPSWYASAESPIMKELRNSPDFTDVVFDAFEWPQSFSASEYCTVISSYSNHSTLPVTQLSALLSGIAEVIDGAGGTITVPYRAGLYLARRVPGN